MEGPKRKESKGGSARDSKRKRDDRKGGGVDGAAMAGVVDVDFDLDTQPGDEVTLRGVRAYYTCGSQRLDEVAKEQGLDPKDLVVWNKVRRCKLDPSLKETCFQSLNLRVHTLLST